MKFHPINPQAQQFPKPKLSVLPLLSADCLGFPERNPQSAYNRTPELYRDGRSAIAHALQLLGHSSQDTVLFPAYHCGSMIDPAIWLGTNISLYKVNRDLTPDLDHIKQLLLELEHPVKSLVIVHYFGFFQNLAKVAQLCKENGISLIEDCAHAYYRLHNSEGSVRGDLAIASPRKFFPIADGGLLVINNSELQKDIPLQPSPIKSEIKAFYNCLQTTTLYPKPGVLGRCINKIESLRSNARAVHPVTEPEFHSSTELLWFEPEKFNISASLVSKIVMRFSAHQRIILRRRQNYQYLYNAANKLSKAYPLYPLNDETVPYMLPLVITDAEQQFSVLKQLAVPIWRWEELAESDCQNSQHYRTHLLHIPCHQSLTIEDLDWMVARLAKILA